MREMHGSCLCGQVTYSANAEPAFVGVCHCKNCQRHSGTAFALVVGVPSSAMSLHGRLSTYRDTGESGRVVLRNFCPECGSAVTTEPAVMSGMTLIKAGTLDDTSWIDPKVHVYCDSAQKWTSIPERCRKFAKMPA
jgi:hypothetical protein